PPPAFTPRAPRPRRGGVYGRGACRPAPGSHSSENRPNRARRPVGSACTVRAVSRSVRARRPLPLITLFPGLIHAARPAAPLLAVTIALLERSGKPPAGRARGPDLWWSA